MTSTCPQCKNTIDGVFPSRCPNCDFDVDALAGRGTTDFQMRKWAEHSDILQGRSIGLYGKRLNASFDFRGYARLDDLVRFTISFGDTATVQSPHGVHANPITIAYFPKVIGSGTSLHFPGRVACSGLALMSPHSHEYAHSFPVMDLWVQREFGHLAGTCRLCGAPTSFGQPVCIDCYPKGQGDWLSLMTNT